MDFAIKIENLSKQYRLGTVSTGTLSHDLKRKWALMRGKEDPYLKIGDENKQDEKGNSEYVWALSNINIEVPKGEVLGIIGKNGAGKSTLLKILSKVTGPTKGSISYKGRIGALLEVGTGFHHELTGRENVFLNGAILGMTNAEIKTKLDEIVDFSGVEKYIDTPVKRYSSGMMVRLGFAVAAHLEPEILVVDEVLAVGDAEFQKKAIGKMKDVSNKDGRTVLFVSHNMAAVKSLCRSAIVLQDGKEVFSGTPSDAINEYLKFNHTNSSYCGEGDISNWLGNENIKIKHFVIKALNDDIINISSGIIFKLKFYNFKQNINLDATFELSTFDEITVFHGGTLITTSKDSKVGFYEVIGEIPPSFLNAGSYKFKLIFGENQRYPLFIYKDIISFEILNEGVGSNTAILPGVVRPNIDFNVSFLERELLS